MLHRTISQAIDLICKNCEEYRHKFGRLLVATEENHIRNAKYCVCCGMMPEN